MASKLQSVLDKIRENQGVSNSAPAGPSGQPGWVEGISRTFLNSMGPGLIGIAPAPDLQRWQAENPWSSIGAELLGVAVPYTGWFKASTAVPKLGAAIKAIETGEGALTAPYRSAMAAEAMRWTPFEAGRVGLTSLFGDPGSTQEVLEEGLVNIGLGMGLGALAKGLSSVVRDSSFSRRNAQIAAIFPNYDPSQPAQIRLRTLGDLLEARKATLGKDKSATDDIIPIVESLLQRDKIIVRAEVAKKLQGERAFGNYLKDVEGDGDRQALNRLFYRVTGSESTQRKLLAEFDDVDATLAPFGINVQTPEAYMQFPRITSFKESGPAERMFATVRKNMQSVGKNTWMAREKDGLYMLALRAEGQNRQADKWLTLKTDAPGVFLPGAERWTQAVENVNAWLPARMSPKLLQDAAKLNIYGGMQKWMQAVPFQAVKGMEQGNVSKLAGTVARGLGYKGDLRVATSQLDEITSIVKSKVAPAMFQFSNNPLARYILATARNTYDHASTLSSKMYWGDVQSSGNSLFSYLVNSPIRKGGLHEFYDKLDDADVEILRKAWLQGMSPEDAMKLGASDTLVDFMKELGKVDDWMISEIRNTAKVTGGDSINPTKHHLGISRLWRGDYRLPVYNQKGDLVYMASGHLEKQAANEAKAIIDGARGKGVTLQLKDPKPFLADRMDDLKWVRSLRWNDPASRTAVNLRANPPRTFNERTGVGGFVGEHKWTKNELFDNIKSHLSTYNNYLAETSTLHGVSDMLGKLLQQDPLVYRQVTERLRDMAGKPGPLGKVQNYFVDKVLSPVLPLGKNSASKIVAAANTAQVNFQLGMGNAMFPVMNALTFVQTVIPHLAFVLKSAPEAVSKYYTWMPLKGRQTQSSVGVLDMMKLMGQSFKQMARPEPGLKSAFHKAAEEGVVDPRFAEEYIGEAVRRLHPRHALSGEVGWIDYIKNISEFPIGITERFGRGHAFTVGHMTGELLGLREEKLYQFAKDFTRNTMYAYSVADRAKILSGPLGSAFGLFKNWQMHYIGSMASYFDQGFNYNNWAPLLWQTAGTVGVAGLGGAPLYSAADTASRWMTNEPLMVNLYNAVGLDKDDTTLDDGIFYGLPSFMGVTLQGSAAAPTADAARDFSMFFSFAIEDRAKALSSAVGDAIDTWTTTGRHPFSNPAVRDEFIRALGPRSLYRTMQVVQDSALRSIHTGYPVTDNLQLWERFAFAAGFTPVEVERAYAANNELWTQQQTRKDLVSSLGEQYYRAQGSGDLRTMQRILDTAVVRGISTSSVLRSAAARESKSQQTPFERNFKPRDVAVFQQAGIIE